MRTVVICCALILALAVSAGAAQTVLLYNGDAQRDSGGILLGSWGSGYLSETYNTHYIGPQVLKLLSQGYYQGGVLTFRQPVPLAGFLDSSDSYLELWIKPSVILKPAERRPVLGGLGNTGRTGSRNLGNRNSRNRGGIGGNRQSGYGGRTGGAMGGGMGGNWYASAQTAPITTINRRPVAARATTPAATAQTQTAAAKPRFLMQRLRVVLVTDRGELIASSWPISPGTLVGGGWRRVAIPLSVFKSAAPERGSAIHAMRIFADRADNFYIGQIGLVRDTAPLHAIVTATPKVAKVGAVVKFNADVESGAGTPVISWDMDVRDGIQADAQGADVEWTFQAAGVYTVTCTVTDRYGSKAPASKTIVVTVAGTAAKD